MADGTNFALALLGDPGHECPPNCLPTPCPCANQCSSCSCPCPESPDGGGHHNEADPLYMHSPKVEFPTLQDLFDYYYQQGIKKDEFSIISNATEGSPSEVQEQ